MKKLFWEFQIVVLLFHFLFTVPRFSTYTYIRIYVYTYIYILFCIRLTSGNEWNLFRKSFLSLLLSRSYFIYIFCSPMSLRLIKLCTLSWTDNRHRFSFNSMLRPWLSQDKWNTLLLAKYRILCTKYVLERVYWAPRITTYWNSFSLVKLLSFKFRLWSAIWHSIVFVLIIKKISLIIVSSNISKIRYGIMYNDL